MGHGRFAGNVRICKVCGARFAAFQEKKYCGRKCFYHYRNRNFGKETTIIRRNRKEILERLPPYLRAVVEGV
jgi:hypothetical protein